MIILDTDVIAEPMRERPNDNVMAWLQGTAGDQAYTTAITVSEIFHGIGLLPSGSLREALLTAAEETFARLHDRVLAFDLEAAHHYAEMRTLRRLGNQSLTVEDGMIAAICRREGAVLATRSPREYEDLGIELVNPWSLPRG